MGIERLTDTELDELHAHCEAAAKKHDALLAKTKAEREARRKR
jgi:hypothetical protein